MDEDISHTYGDSLKLSRQSTYLKMDESIPHTYGAHRHSCRTRLKSNAYGSSFTQRNICHYSQ